MDENATDEAVVEDDAAETPICAACIDGPDFLSGPGTCDRCRGETASRSFRLCAGCAEATGDCAACLRPTDEGSD